MKATRTAATLALLLTLATASSGVYAANGNPGVIPPHANYRGLTYGEWASKWWQAAFAMPVVNGDHPVFSGGAFGGQDGVAFLAAVFGSPAEVDVIVSSGTPLFFPVINAECSVIEPPPFHGDDEATLRACANGHIDQTSAYSVELDGRELKNLTAYRVESPLFEFGPLPANNILGAPAGATSESVDAGVYLLLTPLSVGQHELRVRATLNEFGSIDTTFNISVVPKGR